MDRKLSIYFYHTRSTKESYEEWKKFHFPGHLLYGLPLLEKYGIQAIMHKHRYIENRFKLMYYVTRKILFCTKKYDVLYGTSFRGLELIIFLRALGLYHKPIMIWHHTALRKSKNKFKESISHFFYKGIDEMFLFSQKLIDDSKQIHKVSANKLHLVHWGPDLAFYDHLMKEIPQHYERKGFISTGKENRDILTLIEAFRDKTESLDIYIARSCGNVNYEKIIGMNALPSNIQVHFTEGVIPYALAKEVIKKQCIVISCLEVNYSYTVGLTTLVEALALGLPVICTRNPNFEIDIDKEQIGITVPYNDVKGWINAINFLLQHPETAYKMGNNARKLAEERFNLEILSQEVASILLQKK